MITHTLILPIPDLERAARLIRRILRYKTHEITNIYLLSVKPYRRGYPAARREGPVPEGVHHLAVITYWTVT